MTVKRALLLPGFLVGLFWGAASCGAALPTVPSLREDADTHFQALHQVASVLQDSGLVVSGLSTAEPLSYRLVYEAASDDWTLSITAAPQDPAWLHLRQLSIWCERCTAEGTPAQLPLSGMAMASVAVGGRPLVGQASSPGAAPGSTVVLVLRGAWIPGPQPRHLPHAATRLLQQAASTSDCTLAPAGIPQAFNWCVAIPSMGGVFHLMWSVVQPGDPATPGLLLMGLNGTTSGQGYVSVGFPSDPGAMSGADAFILQDCPSCSSGAELQGWHMSGTTYADVSMPSRMAAIEIVASAAEVGGTHWIGGMFQVELPASSLSSASFPLIFATGWVTGSSRLVMHDYNGEGEVSFSGGTISELEAERTKYGARLAHGILMVLTWGIAIPVGVLVAHCFREYEPLWFKTHRWSQSLAFLLALVGFGLGFAITGSWDTPFAVHRNLGMAVTVLGLAQVSALVYRPLKTSPSRGFWDWGHWWVGRAAAACAVANIYYGIINVAFMDTWAWATYTALLGAIVAVAVVKDGVDLLHGRRTLASLCIPTSGGARKTKGEHVESSVELGDGQFTAEIK